MTASISPVNAQKVWLFSANGDGTLSPATIGGGGSGTVTNIATTSPITGGPITTTGTIGCATCTTNAAALTANALVIGGGGQATAALGSLGTTTTVLHGNASGAPTYGSVVLSTDVSGQLPIGNVGSAGLSGTSPITISAAGAIACATCNTSAGSLTNNTVLKGAGSQGIQLASITDDGTTVTVSEVFTLSRAGALSVSTVNITGAPITGGSGTTTFPLVYLNTTGATAPTSFSTNGTFIATNGPSGFTGNHLDCHVNGGGSVFNVNATGQVTSAGSVFCAASSAVGPNGLSLLRSAANGRIAFNNNANASGGLTRVTFGTEASANPAFSFDGTTQTITTCDGAGTAANGIMNSALYKSGGTSGVSAGSFSSITAITSTGGIITQLTGSSDERLKDAAAFDGGLSIIQGITPIRYRWNKKGQEHTGISGDKEFVGFSAQNVQNVLPEAITNTEKSKDGSEEYLSFDDRPVVAALVNAVKELSARVVLLESR